MFQKLLILTICLIVFSSCTKKDPVQYSLTSTSVPADGGTVSPASGLYKESESVVLTAIPSAEYLFTSWSDGGTVNPQTVVMNAKKIITANFEKRKHPLSINIIGDRTVKEEIVQTKSVTNYSSGTLVKLTALPNIGSEFSGWNGDYVGSDNPKVLTIDKAKSLTATFEKLKYEMKIGIVGDGTVLNEDKVLQSTASYNIGTLIKLSALANKGYEFIGWSGDTISKEKTLSLILTIPKNIIANFRLMYKMATYNLNINVPGYTYRQIQQALSNISAMTPYVFNNKMNILFGGGSGSDVAQDCPLLRARKENTGYVFYKYYSDMKMGARNYEFADGKRHRVVIAVGESIHVDI